MANRIFWATIKSAIAIPTTMTTTAAPLDKWQGCYKAPTRKKRNGAARINLGAVEIFAYTEKTGEAHVSISPRM